MNTVKKNYELPLHMTQNI